MKNIINLLFALCVLSTATFAQNKTVIISGDSNIAKKTFNSNSGVLIETPFLNDFVGTWEWKQGNKIFTLVITKIVKNVGSAEKPLEIEMLNGGYKLIIDGKEVSNTLMTKPLYGGSHDNKNPVTFSIINYKNNTQNDINAIMMNKNTIKLEPSRLKREGIQTDPDFYIPLNIILKRKQ